MFRGERETMFRGERETMFRGERETMVRGERETMFRGERETMVRGERETMVRGEREPMVRAFSFPMKAERSRNKERLEASLAGLCELELLKQRQECLVLGALSLGDTVSGRPAHWGHLRPVRCAPPDTANGGASDDYHGPRRQPSSLQWTPWGLMASLEQQVGELRVDIETKMVEQPAELGDSPPCSGEGFMPIQDGPPDSGYCHPVPQPHSAPYTSPEGITEGAGEAEERATWPWSPNMGAEAEEELVEMEDEEPIEEDHNSQRLETFIFGLIQRRALPSRPSKPRTSLAYEAQAITVARQSSLRRNEDPHSPMQVSIQGMPELHAPCHVSEGPSPWACRSLDQGIGTIEDPQLHYHRLQQSTALDKPGLYPRPRHPMVNTPHSASVDYPSYRGLQHDPSSSECDSSPQHMHSYPPPPPPPRSLPQADEQLVNAEYIPAQPCRATARVSAHTHSNPLRCSGGPKPSRAAYSPERVTRHQHQQPTPPHIQHSKSKGGPKKCRLADDRGGAARKPGKKACRSQSENSLQRVPERKYNTVERDGGGSGSGGGGGSRGSQPRGRKPQQGSGGCRRWRSTLELSQDEADPPPMQAPMQPPPAAIQRDQGTRRTRRARPAPPLYAYPHSNHHHPHHLHHMEYQVERDRGPPCRADEGYPHPGHGESESSLSEADSPESISLSSDSDESGGLVWPQQLPPQLSPPSPSTPAGAPLQPKAFIKIKASHALKKKILRFRTGSLKVMTTV